MMRKGFEIHRIAIAGFLLSGLALLAEAAPDKGKSTGPAAEIRLDHERIHAIYNEGDFEHVVAAIDSFTHSGKKYGYNDSVFICKHLAVIYTANPATREKGKGYMYLLLTLVPSAKIVDMFVSDEIDRIFERVREEFVIKRKLMGKAAPTQLESNRYAVGKLSVPDSEPIASKPAKASAVKGKPKTVYWLAAGGVAAISVLGYLYFLRPEKKDVNYDIP